jgi:hypothetical protein
MHLSESFANVNEPYNSLSQNKPFFAEFAFFQKYLYLSFLSGSANLGL